MKTKWLGRKLASVLLALCCMVGCLCLPAAAEEKEFGCKIYYGSDYTAVTFIKSHSSYRIFFTIDGTEPTTDSREYTKKLGFGSYAKIRVAEFNKKGERVGSIKQYEVFRKCSRPEVLISDNLDGTAKVVITTDVKGAEIHYTTDGTEPDENSPELNGVFKVKGRAVIKAVAVRKGWLNSLVTVVDTKGYIRQDSYNDYIQVAYKLTNDERVRRGLDKVELSQELCNAAYIRAKELCEDYENGHTRTNGSEWYTAIKEQGYKFKFAGENYGKLPLHGVQAELMVEMWIESPIHLENIINAFGGDVGIGFYQDGTYTYWVQLFAKKK